MTDAQALVKGGMIHDDLKYKRHTSICNKIKDGSIKLKIEDDFLVITYKDVFIDTIYLNAEDHEYRIHECLGILHHILLSFKLIKL